MWDTIKDNMNSFLGILFLGVPLLITIWYERKNSKEKNKKKKLFIGFIAVIVGCILLTWLGIDKVNRDNKRDGNIDTLTTSLNNTQNKLSHSDSMNTVLSNKVDSSNLFMKELKESFNIIKDPKTSQPINYNTYIKKADKVSIGGQ